MYNEVITLIKEIVSTNEYGDRSVEQTERQLFAKLTSIGQSEFYQAQAVGLKPEVKFILPDYLDYQGELLLKYTPFNGEEQLYKVIRTYRNNNEMELTCNRGID